MESESQRECEANVIDEILPLIGEFGPFQWMLDAIFFTVNLAVTFQLMIMNFSTLTPTWKCAYNDSNSNATCAWNGTFSGDDLRRCDLPRTQWTYIESKDFSLVLSFNLDCKKEWVLHIISSMFFIGWSAGSLFIGWLSDNYGRKKIYFGSVTFTLVVGFLSSFSNHLWLLILCRFIIGFSFAGSVVLGFVIISELVSSRYRPFAGIMIFSSNIIAWSLIAMISYYVNNWRTLNMLCTAPYLLVLGFYKFVPESIKWQVEKGKTDEIFVTLHRMAYWNKKELPHDLNFSSNRKSGKQNVSPFDLFRNMKIALLSISQGIMWCFSGMGYIGILMAVDDLGGSIYTNFVVLNIGSIFSFFLSPYGCTRFGRKRGTTIPLLVGVFACVGISLIPMKSMLIRIIIGIIGKNFVDVAFYSCFTWSSEIYPTQIRSLGLGFLNICAHIGSAASPWIANYLRQFGKWLPFAVMATFLFIGFLSALYLPETKRNTNNNVKVEDNPKDVVKYDNKSFSDA